MGRYTQISSTIVIKLPQQYPTNQHAHEHAWAFHESSSLFAYGIIDLYERVMSNCWSWLDFVKCQAVAAARMKGGYPERVGQPECQVTMCYIFFCLVNKSELSFLHHVSFLVYGLIKCIKTASALSNDHSSHPPQ